LDPLNLPDPDLTSLTANDSNAFPQMRKPIVGLTPIKTSKQLAPVSALLVASLLSGMAAAQQAVPQPPLEQPQQPAPPAPDELPPGQVPPPAEVPPPQYAPPPQFLPPPPAMAGVPVRFAASDGGDYVVSAAGALTGQCRVPCTLQLAPGLNTIRISGGMTITRTVSIPNAPSVVELKRGSPGIQTTGLVLVILGGLGAVYLATTDKNSDEFSTAESEVRLEIAILDVVLVIVGASMALGAARAGVDVRSDVSARASARGSAIRFGGIAAAPIRGGALLGAALQF
jgi:hypothetical protein